MKRLFFLICVIGLGMGQWAAAQNALSDVLTAEEIENYKAEARQLVNFYTFILNILADEESPSSYKQTIIDESYLKLFADAEVQVEDDLVGERSTMTNKDVQAYLKDVDFFFRSASFEHDIADIQMAFRGDEGIFVLVECNRLLEGTYANGDTASSQVQRYFEINLDLQERDIKIASIYTTGEALKPQLTSWWNQLDTHWKDFFGSQIFINDSVSLNDFHQNGQYPNIGDTLLIQETSSILVDDSLTMSLMAFKGISAQIGDTISWTDSQTVYINTPRLKADLKHLISRKKLDLSQTELPDLSPIELFEELEELDLSQSQLRDIFSLRQLKNLKRLNLSNTRVSNLDALKYLGQLDSLNLAQTPIASVKNLRRLKTLSWLSLSGTQIKGLEGLEGLEKLEYLSIENTEVKDLKPLKSLKSLQTLILNNSGINDLAALLELKNLSHLEFSQTEVSDLKPLNQLHRLTYINAAQSLVKDLSPLSNLLSLKEIDINASEVSESAVREFQAKNDYVTIYFQTIELLRWWETLGEELQAKLKENFAFEEANSRNLHQLIKKRKLDLSELQSFRDLRLLAPFQQLSHLNLEGSGLDSLLGIEEYPELMELEISQTSVSSLEPLDSLIEIKKLWANACPISSLEPLASLSELEELYVNNTNIRSLKPLINLPKLSYLEADACGLEKDSVWNLIHQKPKMTVIFRTEELQLWWESLNPSWQKALGSRMEGDPSNPRVLHQFTAQKNLQFNQKWRLSSLKLIEPMFALEELDVRGMGIRRLTGVEKLTHLSVLKLAKNPIEDLSPLDSLKKLTYLDISNSAIKSLEPLGNATQLKALLASGNQIRSLDGLEKLTKLEHLDCSSTRIKSLVPLDGLVYLKTLNCTNTEVSSKKVSKFKEKHPLCNVIFY